MQHLSAQCSHMSTFIALLQLCLLFSYFFLFVHVRILRLKAISVSLCCTNESDGFLHNLWWKKKVNQKEKLLTIKEMKINFNSHRKMCFNMRNIKWTTKRIERTNVRYSFHAQLCSQLIEFKTIIAVNFQFMRTCELWCQALTFIKIIKRKR